ncbi:MAG: Fic family protein [Niastella sp.]|uniref:Fic family protein n=1 Tax=Niastella sp. TaxID=1869183 RepID=UPI00389ADD01
MSIAKKFKLLDTLKDKIDELKPVKDWDDAFFRKVKFEFTYTSNKLEGNTLTYGQTIKLLRDFVTPKDATKGEVLDMVNHQKILDSIFINYRSQEIAEENIKELHRELMKDRAQWADDGLYRPGQYKEFENMTVRASGKIHTYLLPNQVTKGMEELIVVTNDLLKRADTTDMDLHPLTIATYFHQQFLNVIHPFSDGNGRIGRIFTNLILLKNGYPPVFIKEVNKEEYLKRFELSDNDIYPMLDFMSDRLIESLEEKWEFMKGQK